MRKRRSVLLTEEKDVLLLAILPPSSRHPSNKEISQRLGISVSRVKTLLHQACIKLGAQNRNQAILYAIKRGEIDVKKLLSLDELVEILSTLGPDALRELAGFMRHELKYGNLPEKDEQILHTEKRKDGILTKRERDVLILASNGLTNQEMANMLYMTVSAVRTFLYRAYKKLGAR